MTRREFLVTSSMVAAVPLHRLEGAHVMASAKLTIPEFHASRRFAATSLGKIAYIEAGRGAAAVFLHGLPMNGYFWRGAIAPLSSYRRCIAPDFMGLGYTEISDMQDVPPIAQADMVVAVLDALRIDVADVVANDRGGAVAQLLAARHPGRVRTLLLTNCDVHTNCPPPILEPVVAAAKRGVYDHEFERHLVDKKFARSPHGIGGVCYANPATLSDDLIECYFRPCVSSPSRRAQFNSAILMCEHSPIQDPEIKALCGRIISNQQAEIEQMKAKLTNLKE